MWCMSEKSWAAVLDDNVGAPSARRFKRPTWLDLRLIAGVTLVAVSVLVGAVLMSSADDRRPMWVASHSLAAGTVLRSADVRTVLVNLGSYGGAYLPAERAVIGRSLQQALVDGELIPADALVAPSAGVVVTVPVRPDYAPRISVGERVTLWLSTKSCRGVVLLSGAPVQDVRSASYSALGSTATTGLLVNLTAADATRVMGALDIDGAIIRAGVLANGELPAPAAGDIGTCAGAGG